MLTSAHASSACDPAQRSEPSQPSQWRAVGEPSPSPSPSPSVWARVDLDALRANYRAARQAGGERRVISVVKADAYGHGAIPVARALEESGSDALAVATVEEGCELRAGGVTAPILLFQGPRGADEADRVLEARLTPIASRFEHLELFGGRAASGSEPLGVHLNVDTGMGRLGFQPDEIDAVLERLRALPGLRVDGVMTHLAEADDPVAPQTELQRERFRAVLAQLRDRGLDPAWVHADPSAGVVHGVTPEATAIRPGLMLYGADPTLDRVAELEPVMSLGCRVIHAKRVEAGARIGYGGTYVTAAPTQILTLPVGYADGLPRSAGGRWSVVIEGRPVPLVGRVSMDLATVDAGPEGAVGVGSEVLIFGAEGGARAPVEGLAAAVGTIAYEILVRIGRRVPRVLRG